MCLVCVEGWASNACSDHLIRMLAEIKKFAFHRLMVFVFCAPSSGSYLPTFRVLILLPLHLHYKCAFNSVKTNSTFPISFDILWLYILFHCHCTWKKRETKKEDKKKKRRGKESENLTTPHPIYVTSRDKRRNGFMVYRKKKMWNVLSVLEESK